MHGCEQWSEARSLPPSRDLPRAALLTWRWPGEWGLSFHSLTVATFKFSLRFSVLLFPLFFACFVFLYSSKLFFFFSSLRSGVPFPMEHFVLWYVPIFSVSLAVTCCGFMGFCPFLPSFHDPVGMSLEKVLKKGISPCQMLLYISGVLELGRLCHTKCGGQDLKTPRFTPAFVC